MSFDDEMSFDEKTGLPVFHTDYHTENDSNCNEEAEPDTNHLNEEPHFEIQDLKASTFTDAEYKTFEDSDHEYEEEYKKATGDNRRKHWVKIKVSDSQPLKRSEHVSAIVQSLKREWPNPEYFDNTDGGLRNSFVVSQNFDKVL